MSGFIGMYQLFVTMEKALEIKLSAQEKQIIGQTLYPLSNKNIYNITKEELKEKVEDINLDNRDLEKAKRFLVNYLVINIKDML